MSEFSREWKDLGNQLGERIIKPSSRPTALLYLVLAVAAFGGVGLWLTQLLAANGQAHPRDLGLGVATYALAIVATSIGDLVLDGSASRNLRFLLYGIAMAALVLSGFLTYRMIYSAADPVGTFILFGTVSPVWATWWLINGVDQRFTMEATPRAAMGGDPGQTL